MSLVGNLADLGLGDIFQIVSLSRRSGTLQLQATVDTGEILFSNGRVVAASRERAGQSFGDHVLERQAISPATYQDMLAAFQPGMTGHELFQSFGLSSEYFDQVSQEYLHKLVYDMFTWDEGTFSFVLEDNPSPWRNFALTNSSAVFVDGVNPQYLAIEGSRVRDERNREDSLQAFLQKDQEGPSAEQEEKTAAARAEVKAALDGEQAAVNPVLTTPLAIPPQAPLAAPMAVQPTQAETVPPPAEPSPDPQQAVQEQVMSSDHTTPDEQSVPIPPEATAAQADAEPAQSAPPQAPLAAEQPQQITQPPEAMARAPLGLPQAPEQSPQPPIAESPLPEAQAPATAAPHDEPPTQEAAPGVGRSQLLIVDDDPQVARALEVTVGKRFAKTTVAHKIADALSCLETDLSQLVVITDLIIARSDGGGILGGIELLEKIRALSPKVPVLIFSDYQNEDAQQRAQELNAFAFEMKPRKTQIQAHGSPEADDSPLRPFITKIDEYLAKLATAAPVDAPQEIVHPHLPMDAAEANLTTAEHKAIADEAPMFDIGAELNEELDDFVAPDMDGVIAAAESGELTTLRSMLAELVDPSNRDTVSLLVLRYAGHVVERAGLFLATRRVYVGLGGFSQEEDSEGFVKRVRRIQIPVAVESVFSVVSKYRSMYYGSLKSSEGNDHLVSELGGKWPPGEVVAVPLISRDRVAAILYGDNPSGAPLGSVAGLEIFLQQAGMAMDRALLERKLEESRG